MPYVPICEDCGQGTMFRTSHEGKRLCEKCINLRKAEKRKRSRQAKMSWKRIEERLTK